MNLVELLRCSEASLPKERTSQDFRDALQSTFAEYANGVSKLVRTDPLSAAVSNAQPKIDSVSRLLLEIIDDSYRGKTFAARSKIDEIMQTLADEVTMLTSKDLPSAKVKTLYRVRCDPPNGSLSRSGIFHIPFEKRHLVSPQRFSVLGVPMLYLSSTIYGCWEELGRPELHKMWISAFRVLPEKTIKVVNFAYRPKFVGELFPGDAMPQTVDAFARFAIAYAISWPLIAASTFLVPDRSAAFKVEYVIPQLLMSWVAEQPDLHGIRYFSTHIHSPGAWETGLNFALPATSVASTGQCTRLKELFEITAPVSWTYAEAAGTQLSYLYHGRVRALLDVGDGYPVPYEASRFAEMEFRLDQLPYSTLP